MAKGSTLVIIVALAGNLAIALAKFVASWISGSTAMLTEAIHSLADTSDQVLFTRSEETRLLVRPELRNVRNVTALQEMVP
jgi:FlaG/FlaF family flagellin (archaellin)